MQFLALAGRVLFSLLFIVSAFGNFSRGTIHYAAQHGVPFASFFVPASGILALVGGLSVLFGYQARIGGWLLFIFLVPVTFTMHNFWAVSDPARAALERINFMKNLALMGGCLIIAYFGVGPASADEILEKRHPTLRPREV